jgi:hypothetical protein
MPDDARAAFLKRDPARKRLRALSLELTGLAAAR